MLFRSLKEVDEETKRILIEVVKSLFEIARENKRKQSSGKTEAVLKRIASKQKGRGKGAEKQEGQICPGEALGNADG